MNIYNKRDMWNVNTSVLTKNPSTVGVTPAIIWGAKVDINANCKKKLSNLQIYVLNSRFLF